ncbi:MAG TPA: inositol monophosphatase family protein [Candidatus Thermoplasmatota archaeon]|nr:inositol monophosphatase family protein [Candidatus Thermoplasmatota archaeon]
MSPRASRDMVEHADLPLMRRMADAVSRVVDEGAPEGFGDVLRMGADGTPTKRVDDLAEKAILDLLPARGIDLLSEEAGFVDRAGDRVLVVDPIDGTTNAARGIPFYCVSLAVGRKTLSDVEAGLVVNLCTGDRFEAVRGQGATLNGQPIRARVDRKHPVYATSGAEDVPATRGVLRSFGASALEMCLVAQGALDGYHYPKPILRIIDVAASTLLVREAGGVVLDLDGKDLELPLSLAPRFGLTAAPDRETARTLGGESK